MTSKDTALKGKIKKDTAKRFAANPFAHKYAESLHARAAGRQASKQDAINSGLKRK